MIQLNARSANWVEISKVTRICADGGFKPTNQQHINMCVKFNESDKCFLIILFFSLSLCVY